MNKMIRMISVLLTAAMLISLTACGGSDRAAELDVRQESKVNEGVRQESEINEDVRQESEINEDVQQESKINEDETGEENGMKEKKTENVTNSAVPKEQIRALGFEYDYDSLNYELVWSDEFDYEGSPDDTKWGYDTGASGWGNNELQYYTRGENAEVKDGVLTITARKEIKGRAGYTSTRLVSKGKGDWLYGKIEVRAKLPTGKGTWPAIWMLPTDWKYGNWPNSGEIDIMEHVGYDQDTVHYSIHTKSYHHSVGTQKTATSRVKGASIDFHIYEVEWLPDKMIFSVDGEETFTYDPTKYKEVPTWKEWPFDKRFHILLNIAVGGDWGGLKGVDEDIWPQSMEVDYVRVYQSPEITAITQ